MIRTHLVKSLYDNLLGPINGPTETVQQPYRKYQIGGNSFEIANIFEIETIISTVIGITALEVST